MCEVCVCVCVSVSVCVCVCVCVWCVCECVCVCVYRDYIYPGEEAQGEIAFFFLALQFM